MIPGAIKRLRELTRPAIFARHIWPHTFTTSMIEPTNKLLRDPSSELVFGLVAPIGADLERLESDLIDQVGLYGYTPNPIRLSALLRKVELGAQLQERPELARLNSYIDAGNKFRERTRCEEGLAICGRSIEAGWCGRVERSRRRGCNRVQRRALGRRWVVLARST
jgi:hypothetical protein